MRKKQTTYFGQAGFAIAIVLIVVLLTMTACGGGNSPKSLAKQAIGLMKTAQKLGEKSIDFDDPKFTSLFKKFEALEEKVDQLSEDDQEIFEEELERLMEKEDVDQFF